jgi:acyl-CoA thioesterase
MLEESEFQEIRESGHLESTAELKTHILIDRTLSGEILELSENYAKVRLETTKTMVADNEGLIHGGFIFSAADFAAMAAVNEPYVVLASAQVDFLAPIEYGDSVEFEAFVKHKDSRKRVVDLIGRTLDVKVFEGKFTTVVLQDHVLDLKLKQKRKLPDNL